MLNNVPVEILLERSVGLHNKLTDLAFRCRSGDLKDITDIIEGGRGARVANTMRIWSMRAGNTTYYNANLGNSDISSIANISSIPELFIDGTRISQRVKWRMSSFHHLFFLRHYLCHIPAGQIVPG